MLLVPNTDINSDLSNLSASTSMVLVLQLNLCGIYFGVELE